MRVKILPFPVKTEWESWGLTIKKEFPLPEALAFGMHSEGDLWNESKIKKIILVDF